MAYWAGGIDALEGGEQSVIPIKSLEELPVAVTKATCIQAMHERVPHDAPINSCTFWHTETINQGSHHCT